jgi:tetratricopeptide (TPR) repeat protein
VALKPSYASAHYNLANGLGAAGRLEEAIAHWRRAAALDPGLAQARENLARALDVRARANAAGHPPD